MSSVDDLQFELGYRFKDTQLLTKALTHSSHANERAVSDGDNEQLEFLGDSVLGFLVSDFLFRTHPRLTEGQLSKLKGFFVSSANLVKYAEQLHLGSYLQLGKGEEKTGGRTKQALLVDAFEAIIAAIYLDGGIEEARPEIVTNDRPPSSLILATYSARAIRSSSVLTAAALVNSPKPEMRL